MKTLFSTNKKNENIVIYALNKKIIDSLEIIKGCRKQLLYNLRYLQVHVIPLDFRVLMLSIIVQLNLFGELRSYKELFETS